MGRFCLPLGFYKLLLIISTMSVIGRVLSPYDRVDGLERACTSPGRVSACLGLAHNLGGRQGVHGSTSPKAQGPINDVWFCHCPTHV